MADAPYKIVATEQNFAQAVLEASADKPVLIGVGISTPAQAVEACTVADGVVIGSALVRRIIEGATPAEAAELVAGFRKGLEAGNA